MPVSPVVGHHGIGNVAQCDADVGSNTISCTIGGSTGSCGNSCGCPLRAHPRQVLALGPDGPLGFGLLGAVFGAPWRSRACAAERAIKWPDSCRTKYHTRNGVGARARRRITGTEDAMPSSTGDRDDDEPRLDVHNANIDQRAADADLCGVTDLRNGRVCAKPALHRGGCDFVVAPEAPTPSG